MKRILVSCSSRVPPNHATASGMAKSALELVQGLARACRGSGVAITVLAHPATRLPTGVQWLAPDPSLDRCGEGFGGEVPPSVERAIADHHVILDQSESPAISIAAARAGTPCIRTIRLAVNGSSNRRAAKHVTLAVHLSEDQRARDHHHPVCRTTVIRDAIPVRAAPACNSTRLRRAISIGRIESDKGHDIAAEVARSLGLPLLAVGPVVDPGYLAQLAGMRGVRVLSPNHRGRALSLLRRSELLIWTPRVIEPGGRVVIEALRLGVPVLGRRFGVLADLADEGSGIVANHAGEPLVGVSTLPVTWPSSPVETARRYMELVRAIV